MKILLVNKFHYMKGGSERYYFTVAETLRRMGHEVVFFAMQDEKNVPCAQEKYFVSNASVRGGFRSKLNMVLHIAYSREAYKKIQALLAAEHPDLVLFNLVHKQITLSILDAIKEYDASLPIFWTMHDLIAVCPAYTMLDGKGQICEKCLHGDFSNCVRNNCIKGSKLMSMLSEYEANYIRKKHWYDKVDVFICPSEFYKNKLTEAQFTKSRIVCLRNPLPPETKYELCTRTDNYALYFGRLSPEKGVRTLIDAAVQADIKLIVLGTGSIEEELKTYAKDKKNVEFKGFQQGEALQNYIRRARCVVLPSEWYENGPYSAMEAMALGKPLIVSNHGGLPELVEDHVNGYIYREKSELPEKLKKLMSLPAEEYEKMCDSSFKRARALFDPEQYVKKLIALYNEIKAR